MKIERWERIDHSKTKVEWKHDTGVRIILQKFGNIYCLSIYDSSGIEHFTTQNPNRTKMEYKATQWQREYNKHLTKVS